MSTTTPVISPATEQGDDGVVQLTVEGDGIAILRLGSPTEKLVTLTERRMLSLDEAIDKLQRDSTLRGVVVTGPGPGMFAAGADITAFETITDAAAGAEAAARGQRLFGRFGELSVPVVGAIEGPCLGGGFEMALGFDVRLASDAAGTSIGLPEVKLGIVPGFGGTQRLTRLVGLPKALDLILAGKVLRPEQALRAGIVDRVVPAPRLLDAARQTALDLAAKDRKAPPRRWKGSAFWLSKPPLRAIVARKVRKTLSRGPAKFYEAPRRALELCLDALRLPPAEGLAREARVLGELIVSPTCRALVHLFFLTERAKKLGKDDRASEIERAMVIGGGVMGAGIAGLFAGKGVRTRLCDLDSAALARAKARLQKDLDKKVRRRRMRKHEAVAVQDRLAVSTEWGSLREVDLFLEAIVEDLDVKRTLIRRAVDAGLPQTAVIATNTSSLPIDAMAEEMPAPERVVGIHFFNPPEKMPLIEVIRGARTSPEAIATACKLAVQLGKFPVIVGDSPGFLVNRCLSPYLNEAALLMLEGNEPEFIDKVMLDFGMPMGPARLLDEVGFDVACKVSQVMADGFPDRMQPSSLFDAMVGARALGKKAGGGLYDASGAKPGPGREILARLRREGVHTQNPADRGEVLERLIYPLVDEAYRCLDENLVDAEEDLDLGLVMGIGFPPFTGGVTRFARSEGLPKIVERLDELARRFGPRFAPGDGLRRRAVDARD